jgi:chorismate dehydratase
VGDAGVVRLGNITYSNCYPVHAGILDGGMSAGIQVVDGVPSVLNRMLGRGEIDVAPCSSIEFARHADSYRVLPDLVIGSRGPVRSILFLSSCDPGALDGSRVAVPTSSATSVVLLKVLLRTRWGVSPDFVWFDQASEDPFSAGASAALFIGDVALRPGLHPSAPFRYDLGEVWWQQTGLPFAFAVWQVGNETSFEQLKALHQTLLASREFGTTNRAALAQRFAGRWGFDPAFLERYWSDLSYELDEPMIEGLRAFYALAAELGEIPRSPELRWI